MPSICTKESNCVTRLKPQSVSPSHARKYYHIRTAEAVSFVQVTRPYPFFAFARVPSSLDIRSFGGPRQAHCRAPVATFLATFLAASRPVSKRLVNTFILFN